MTQHRREIHPAVMAAYGVVDHALWIEAVTTHGVVGRCAGQNGADCNGQMRGGEPEQHHGRWHYPARCNACGREVEGMGPRLEKAG
ncbi:hypothetical protein AB0M54_24420 [Actinoplanes sp. NPDC051470]|uniref:hypothetical protein n=1 Tax=Actinoplanes sp. NPDC051470 TaxID=3157224 RepID=UPI00341DDE03